MTTSKLVTGEQDSGSRWVNLKRDMAALTKLAGDPYATQYTEKALTTAESSPALARINYYTAGGTIAAQDFDLPAAPQDGQEVTILSNQIVTAATFTVTDPGTATIIGAPTALAVNTPVSFKYVASEVKWYRC